MSALVLREIENGLCILTLNRPDKLNALNAAVFREIEAHLDAISPDDVGCVLLAGAGRSFCAGHDLDDISSGKENSAIGRFETGIVERLATLPMPVVAAIRGHCLTGGLELALAADVIIASETAKFADTHAKWDLVPIWGLSQRLPRRVGVARAQEMMFASRTYSGAEAASMGLANFCVPDDRLDEEAARFCTDVIANSWRANRAMKKLIADTDGMTLPAGIAWEMHHSEGRGPDMAPRIARMRKK
ncbi:enoyl-CoA hydratase [alpha proteobacterium U9-1i]|nr:enoyl-CoA hydratase [alpha proteobacterium U9-1i]